MEIKNLSKTYKTEYEVVKALNDMTLKFPDKGLVFIVGVSGSGKSTLMNMLSAVDRPTSGEVYVNGKPLFAKNKNQLFGYRNSYVGLIFQEYNLIEDLNVYDNIKLPLELLGQKDFTRVDEVIKQIDIEEIKHSKVTEISSGQMQRVAIARALVKDSTMILADEPTGNLDSKNTAIVMSLLKKISEDRLVIVITHDDEAALEYGDLIISIEDGKVLEEVKQAQLPYDLNNKEVDFVNPKVTAKQQIKFTAKFIFSNLLRSLTILFVLLIIPIVGNILGGYVFFDIETSYRSYQEEYGSEYLELAQSYNGNLVAFDGDNYIEIIDKYSNTDLLELYSTYSVVNQFDDIEVDSFYKPVIEKLIIPFNQDNLYIIEGYYPLLSNEVAITDYVQAAFEYYGMQIYPGDEIDICGVKCVVSGIIDTNYEEYINYDFSDSLQRIAFEENLLSYNAIYTTLQVKNYIDRNKEYIVENVSYRMKTDDATQKIVTKEAKIVVRKGTSYPNPAYGTRPNSGSHSSFGMISRSLWEDFFEYTRADFGKITRATFICYTDVRYTLSIRVSGIHDYDSSVYGTVGEVIISPSVFEEKYVRSVYGVKAYVCKLLVPSDASEYHQIIEEENIVNPSFSYASSVNDRAERSKYIMIEFLITLIIIMIVFASVINSMTLNQEKKKIGIKYSLGLKKTMIVIPYILEILLYVLTTLALSLVIVKVIYPWIMTNIIYNTAQELVEYEFYYISTATIVGWDLLIYMIMLISLISMILTIYKKSPIEIIKDL